MEQQRTLYEVVRVGEIEVEASLNTVQLEMMLQVQFVLKPFKEATRYCQSHIVITLLRKKMTEYLDNHILVPEVKTQHKSLKLKIGNCLESLWEREAYNHATMLIPEQF